VTAAPPDGYSRTIQDVTIVVLPDNTGHLRVASNDQEILDRCEPLRQVIGNPATLVIGDSGGAWLSNRLHDRPETEG